MNKRCIVIVLDGLGIGETDDVSEVRSQDKGANTLRSIINHSHDLKIPNLTKLGLLEALAYEIDMDYSDWDYSAFSRIKYAHYGADTFFGHHEIMGSKPMKPIPQRFNDVIGHVYNALVESGYKVEKVGKDNQQILLVNNVLTVADNIECDLGSAFNVTASLDHISFEEVVKIGRIVRGVVTVPRVIAFAGREISINKILEAKEYKGEFAGINAPKSGVYDKDYHCIHLGFGIDSQKQVPHVLSEKGIDTYLIGKVADIVENKKENTYSMVKTDKVLEKVLELMDQEGFICANVQETDLSGHAQNVDRYATILNIADKYIGRIIEKMAEQDLLMVIADHGNDPLIGHSKHTREYVPLLIYGQAIARKGKIEQQYTLANIGATVCRYFGCDYPLYGNAFTI
jgi:phosphopentomutase